MEGWQALDWWTVRGALLAGNDEWGTDASRERVDAASTSEILWLKHECGVTDRGIARSLSVARSTIALTLERVAAGLGWPFPATLADRLLEAMLYAGHGRQQGGRCKAEPYCIDGLVPSAGHTSRDAMRRTSKTEAFDGKEGRAADSAAVPVPGGHTLVPPLSPSESPNPTSENLSANNAYSISPICL